MSKMKDLFVSLVLNKHNLQIMHWNCFGVDFDPTHEKLAQYIDQLDTYIDEVAEMLKMCGEAPLSLTECVEYAQASDVAYIVLPNTDYCARAIWANCKSIFESLTNIYLSISDSDYPRDIVSKLDEHCYWFRLEGVYKGTARLKEVSCEPDATEEVQEAPPEDLPPQAEAEEIPASPSTPEYEDDSEKEVLHDDDADEDNDESDDHDDDDIDAPEPDTDDWDDDIIPDDDI